MTGSGGRPADLGTGDLHDKIIGRYSNLREPHGHKVDHPNWLAMGEQAATNRITRSALNLEIQLGGATVVGENVMAFPPATTLGVPRPHQQESQTIPVMPIPPQIVISALHPPSLQLARARVRHRV